jgi:hypothetical protein
MNFIISNELGELLANYESGNDGYDARNIHGKAETIPLSQMTLQELYRRQNLPWDHADHLGAAGKYQMTKSMVEATIQHKDFNLNQKLTPAYQEHLYSEYMLAIDQHEVIKKYITNQPNASLQKAEKAVPDIWVAAKYIDDKGHEHGRYDQPHPQSKIPAKQIGQALDTMRNRYQDAIQMGYAPDEVWRMTTQAPTTFD